MKRWLNILTGLALGFIIIIGIWKANPETLKTQPFLLDGSNGVRSKFFLICVTFLNYMVYFSTFSAIGIRTVVTRCIKCVLQKKFLEFEWDIFSEPE